MCVCLLCDLKTICLFLQLAMHLFSLLLSLELIHVVLATGATTSNSSAHFSTFRFVLAHSVRVVECLCVKHFTDHFVSVAAAAATAVAPSLHFIISYKFFSYFPRCEYKNFLILLFLLWRAHFCKRSPICCCCQFFSGSIHFRQSFYEAICFSRAQSTLLHTHIFAIVYTENCLNRQNKWQKSAWVCACMKCTYLSIRI